MNQFKMVPVGMGNYDLYKRYWFFFWECLAENRWESQCRLIVKHQSKPTLYI